MHKRAKWLYEGAGKGIHSGNTCGEKAGLLCLILVRFEQGNRATTPFGASFDGSPHSGIRISAFRRRHGTTKELSHLGDQFLKKRHARIILSPSSKNNKIAVASREPDFVLLEIKDQHVEC
jgi:hypothetical protein